MQNNDMTVTDTWRWKMIRKVAEYINQPDDINKSELNAMIERYQDYSDIRDHVQQQTT